MPVRRDVAEPVAVDEHGRADVRGRVADVSSAPRGTTSGRACSECGAMNVTAIASRPRTSTGPPFERLYAVDPAGRRADHPVARHDAEILAADRPRELDHPPERRARRDDVVHRRRRSRRRPAPRASAARARGSSPAKTRRRSSSRPSGAIEARKPTRPKLTPITGTSVPSSRASVAQDRAVAAERDREVRLAPDRRRRGRRSAAASARDALDAASCTSTAAVRRRSRRRSTGARRRASIRRVEVIGEASGCSAWTRWRKNSRFPFGPGSPESTTPATCSPPTPAPPRRPRAATRRAHLRVAHDAALRRTSPRPASNCGLTSTSACQPGAASRSAGGSAMRTEMKETSQTTSCGGNGSSASARAFVRSSTVTRGSPRSRG